MSRTNELSFYATDATKRELDRRAEAEDVSRSDYLNRLVVRFLQQEDADDFADEVHAEDRIRELVQIATDQMQQATAEMRDLNAKTGTYAAANFELLKTNYKDAARRDALSTGSRRMRKDLDVVQAELDDTPRPTDTSEESQQSRERLETTDTPDTDENQNQNDNENQRQGPLERIREADDVRE